MLYVMLRSRIAGRVDVHFPSVVIPHVLIALFMFLCMQMFICISMLCVPRTHAQEPRVLILAFHSTCSTSETCCCVVFNDFWSGVQGVVGFLCLCVRHTLFLLSLPYPFFLCCFPPVLICILSASAFDSLIIHVIDFKAFDSSE